MVKIVKKIEPKPEVKEVIPPKKETKLNNIIVYKCPKCGNRNNVIGQRCAIDNEIMQYLKE